MNLAIVRKELQAICNGKTAKLGDMVMADLVPNIFQIKLGCWISKVPGYLKNCGRVLTDETSFTLWAGKACRFQSKNRRAALEWTMEKPVDEAAKAKEAAGVAKTIRLIPVPLKNGKSGPRVMDDVEDTTSFEKMLTKIALKGRKDQSIDQHIDVFRMPGDLSRYVLMTPGHINEWAKDAIDISKPAVTEYNPPSHMRFHTHDLPVKKKRQIVIDNDHGPSGSFNSTLPSNGNIGTSGNTATPKPMRESGGMEEFLTFCKIPDAKGVAKVFSDNFLFDYQSLAAGDFKEEHIKEMGFRGGMWINLRSNIKRYEDSLLIRSSP
ncbi:hypothetical protein DFH28DRAFT_925665 [Melampsora americana]|nr:hypothetical protein DFH28DRAFT_925665 [Melampsora americana]